MRTKPPEGGLTHVVEDGQWAGSIAIDYGFADWEKHVWEDGGNSALRQKRDDPHLLAEGDELFIPPWQEHKETCATEQRHKFQMKVPSEVLRIRVLDPEGLAVKDAEYQLTVNCRPGGGVFKQQNEKTDGEGFLEEQIPSTAVTGKLVIPSLEQSINLLFGKLTPMDPNDKKKLTRGAQERLAAIGFDPGPIDGIMGPKTRAAVMSFQSFCADEENQKKDPRVTDSGPVDGIIGPKTRAALKKYYGC